MSFDKLDERKVTTDLEHGNGSSLAQLFQGKFEEDRFKSLHTIEELYKQDVAAHRAGTSNLEFNTSDFWHNEIKIDDNNSGKTLFYDQLDLKVAVHHERSTVVGSDSKQVSASDRTYAVPADRQPIDPKVVAAVTRDLENGDSTSLGAAFTGKMQEERVHFLKEVRTLNEDNLKKHKTEISLEIDVEGFKHHTNELNVRRNAPGGLFSGNFWSNPASVYYESLDMNSDKREIRMTKDNRK